jgi:hypothetical protein
MTMSGCECQIRRFGGLDLGYLIAANLIYLGFHLLVAIRRDIFMLCYFVFGSEYFGC